MKEILGHAILADLYTLARSVSPGPDIQKVNALCRVSYRHTPNQWRSFRRSVSNMEYFSMSSNLFQQDTEARVFRVADASRRDNGFWQGASWPEGLPALAPWSKLSWGLFLPLVFAGNVVVATLAWIIVGLVMR